MSSELALSPPAEVTPSTSEGDGAGITLGAGLTKTQGSWRPLGSPGSYVQAICDALTAAPPDVEGWWSPHRWDHNSRASGSRWISAIAVVLDLDVRKHIDGKSIKCAPTPAMLHDVPQCAPLSAWHETPHGFRLILVFDEAITDIGAWKQLAEASIAIVRTGLERFGFMTPDATGTFIEIDLPASCDTHRLFFRPRSRVQGEERRASMHIIRHAPFSPPELMRLARTCAVDPEETDLKLPTTPPPSPSIRDTGSSEIDVAAARYRAEHREPWPKHPGTCPACGHNDCFHQLPDSADRWFCFSTSHPDACGLRSGTGTSGDVIDLDVWRERAAGGAQERVRFLRDKGYLAKPRENMHAATPEPAREDGGDPDFARIAAEISRNDSRDALRQLRSVVQDLPADPASWKWLGALAQRRSVIAQVESVLPDEEARRAFRDGAQSHQKAFPRPAIAEARIKSVERALTQVAGRSGDRPAAPTSCMGDLRIIELKRVVHRVSDRGQFDLTLRLRDIERTATRLSARDLRSYTAISNIFFELGLPLPTSDKASEVWSKRCDELLQGSPVRTVSPAFTRSGQCRILISEAILLGDSIEDDSGLEQSAVVVHKGDLGEICSYSVKVDTLVSRVQERAEKEKFTREEILAAARSMGASDTTACVGNSKRVVYLLEFPPSALSI